jgi:hypothetical protein
VAGVGTAVEAHDKIEVRTEHVDDFALTLVAPAQAENAGMRFLLQRNLPTFFLES